MTINHLGANSRGGDMTEGQNDKYLKHNDHIDLLADATQAKKTVFVGISSGNTLFLSAEDFTEAAVLHLRADSGSPSLDGDFVLQVPATQRRFAVFNDTGFTCYVESAGSPGSQVEVPDGGRADLHQDGESIEEIKRDIYDLSFFADTWSFDAILGAHVAVRNFTLRQDLPGSQAYAYTPTGAGESDRVVSIQKNESEIGTITLAGFANSGTFSFTADVSFAAGDRLRLVNGSEPSPSETNTLANVAITLKANSF